jgi:osmoprotectant transport system permease protein
MQEMNSRVQVAKATERQVAGEFLAVKLNTDSQSTALDDTLAKRLWITTVEHLKLVVPSLLAALLVSVPLGILASRRLRLGQVVLATTGVLQTIPSLALLLFLMPLTKWLLGSGIGAPTAIAALFLYSLLPIVRNTYAGLMGIAPSLRESAEALGLTRWAILWRVELPLAAPTILAGVKTAAVINVGTATLGGFIGAGGYGRPILRGIDKYDLPMMLEGAIPAALMAILVEGIFGLVERAIARRRG